MPIAHRMHLKTLRKQDLILAQLLEQEQARQMDGLELIPSENLVSQAVLEALGSVATNKYAEGYPGKRYYGGNEFIDQIENQAIGRAKQIFGSEHANVQPHAGSQANMATYYAAMEPGDVFMALKLSEGGHLTHGHKVNFSGKLYQPVQYGVDRETDRLDYDAIAIQASEVKPKLIVSGYTAYPRAIDFRKFRKICDEVNAVCMADISHIAGLVAGGAHENPAPFFDIVTTTTHKTLRGPRGAMILSNNEWGIKIDKAVFPGLQGGPIESAIAAKAVAFGEAQQPAFKDYAHQIVKNARALAKNLSSHGLRLISGGTDTHLILIDTMSLGIPGKIAETRLDACGIYCNKNTIPFDARSPFDPSGIRIGTPTLTTRGMKEKDMDGVGTLLAEGLKAETVEQETVVRKKVKLLCDAFPFYEKAD